MDEQDIYQSSKQQIEESLQKKKVHTTSISINYMSSEEVEANLNCALEHTPITTNKALVLHQSKH